MIRKEPFEPLHIDMTPMVDAIFAIILFLVATSSIVESLEQDLSIDLPKMSKTARPDPKVGAAVIVNVRLKEGKAEYHIENQVMTINAIQNYLSKKRMINKDQMVVIRGDRYVKWNDIANVLKAAADSGISKLSATYEVLETR
jgi:biopolymer transport protein ExbD